MDIDQTKIVPKYIYYLRDFFDTFHDFHNTSLCYNTLLNVQRNNPSEGYTLTQMAFSFMLKQFLDDINQEQLQQILDSLPQEDKNIYEKLLNYSNFKAPFGVLPSPLSKKDLENSFLKYCIIDDGSKNISILTYNENDKATYRKNELQDIIKKWLNIEEGQTAEINITVDTQKKIYDIIGKEEDKEEDEEEDEEEDNKCSWNYILTRFNIYDPASKKNPLQPQTLKPFTQKKCYIDSQDNSEFYEIDNVSKTVNNMKIGNVNFKDLNKGRPTVATDFYDVSETYILNSSSAHPACISKVTKNIRTAQRQKQKKDKEPVFNSEEDTILNIMSSVHTAINDDENLRPGGNFQVNGNMSNIFDIYYNEFFKKRWGDESQAEFCRIVNKKESTGEGINLINYGTKDTKIFYKENPIILVTIDRMLFVSAYQKGVPCILDMGKNRETIVYLPDREDKKDNSGESDGEEGDGEEGDGEEGGEGKQDTIEDIYNATVVSEILVNLYNETQTQQEKEEEQEAFKSFEKKFEVYSQGGGAMVTRSKGLKDEQGGSKYNIAIYKNEGETIINTLLEYDEPYILLMQLNLLPSQHTSAADINKTFKGEVESIIQGKSLDNTYKTMCEIIEKCYNNNFETIEIEYGDESLNVPILTNVIKDITNVQEAILQGVSPQEAKADGEDDSSISYIQKIETVLNEKFKNRYAYIPLIYLEDDKKTIIVLYDSRKEGRNDLVVFLYQGNKQAGYIIIKKNILTRILQTDHNFLGLTKVEEEQGELKQEEQGELTQEEQGELEEEELEEELYTIDQQGGSGFTNDVSKELDNNYIFNWSLNEFELQINNLIKRLQLSEEEKYILQNKDKDSLISKKLLTILNNDKLKSLNINLLQDINRYYINNLVNILALYEYNLILNEDDARCYYTEVDNFNKIKTPENWELYFLIKTMMEELEKNNEESSDKLCLFYLDLYLYKNHPKLYVKLLEIKYLILDPIIVDKEHQLIISELSNEYFKNYIEYMDNIFNESIKNAEQQYKEYYSRERNFDNDLKYLNDNNLTTKGFTNLFFNIKNINGNFKPQTIEMAKREETTELTSSTPVTTNKLGEGQNNFKSITPQNLFETRIKSPGIAGGKKSKKYKKTKKKKIKKKKTRKYNKGKNKKQTRKNKKIKKLKTRIKARKQKNKKT